MKWAVQHHRNNGMDTLSTITNFQEIYPFQTYFWARQSLRSILINYIGALLIQYPIEILV